eukprot:TRINITY_DN590_c0_g2_i1.p2 TRINITY_DN590_c0_g2~~TRINITY_DN590_c0_g2_i1.p2  ORF type:complete len:182 (-),score=65.14 TRINITY_DN590_c0_g2_i1:89-634(-)
MKNGKPVAADHHSETCAPNENDYAIGIVVRYGKFSYGTFGDLDGEYSSCTSNYVYDDCESNVKGNVGSVDVYHVNHHGSSHSSNAGFVSTLQPTASILTLGSENTYGHPTQTVLDRLLSYGAVFLTERGDPNIKYGSAVVAAGDITLTSDGGEYFTVVAGPTTRQFKAKNSSVPTCTVPQQ